MASEDELVSDVVAGTGVAPDKAGKVGNEEKKYQDLSAVDRGVGDGNGLIKGMQIREIDWALGYCGYDDKIINFGHTFRSDVSCLARVGGDLPMIKKTGVYMISWNVETLDYSRQNGIGICTADEKHKSYQTQEGWYQSKYHIGWDFGGSWHNSYAPRGLLCGWNNKENNLFYKSGKFIGANLPSVKEKDTASLIYDSNQATLYFKLNNRVLPTRIEKIPNDKPLYWFVGKKNYLVQCTMIRINYLPFVE